MRLLLKNHNIHKKSVNIWVTILILVKEYLKNIFLKEPCFL